MREEVLLRKLLADGEGTGEERRFQLLNACLRLLRSLNTVSKAEAVKALRLLRILRLALRSKQDRMYSYIKKCEAREEHCAEYLEDHVQGKLIDSLELSMRKQREIAEMSERQTKEYEEMAERVDREIATSRDKMAQAKNELAAARLVRKNRKEYALLVGMIDDLPSRAETSRKLEDMQEELSQQQERQQLLESRLSERRNHLHALNIILANFQKLLADEDSELSNEAAAEPGERKEDEKDEQRSNREKSSESIDMGD